MRKSQMAGHRPSEQFVDRTERRPGTLRVAGSVPRTTPQAEKPAKRAPVPRPGATMDYQMGFASGSSI